MKIKGMDGMEHSVTGQGQGTYNTVGASAGILALLGGGNSGGCGNGGILSGLLGGGNSCNNDCHVNQTELAYATALAACQGREYALNVAREESAAIFAESRRQDDRLAAVVKDTTGGLLQIGNAVAELNQITKCLQIQVDRDREEGFRNLRESKEYTDCKVNAEAQLRKCGDDAIAAWTQAELNKKINGTLVLNGDDVMYSRCKPVLEQCGCGSPSNPINVKLIEEAATAAAIAAVKAMK